MSSSRTLLRLVGFVAVGSLFAFLVGYGLVSAVEQLDETSASRVEWLVVAVCAFGGGGDAWWYARTRGPIMRGGLAIACAAGLGVGAAVGAGLALG